MTQQEKQILLQDLCARLPYRVNIQVKDWAILDTELTTGHINRLQDNEIEVRPYLRPMSSMTQEERLIYEQRLHDVGRSIDVIDADDVVSHIDWLLSRHLDFRGLIPMGLALEALPGMYETE